MGETVDRRAVRTKKALKTAMFELLKKKDVSKITVSELAEHADIGRGTFYLHYADPYDLLDKIEDELISRITAPDFPMTESWRYAHLLGYLEQVWRYMYENKALFQVLMGHQDGTRFIRKCAKHSEKVARAAVAADGHTGEEDMYNITYVISGTLGIFQKWMEEGAVMPPERLAQIARRMISGLEDEE